jgi:hypothetical protein
VEKVEVVIDVRETMINSFNNSSHAKKVLTLRGWNPPNFACLDDPDILESAPEDVKANMVQVLQSREVDFRASQALIPQSQQDLVAQGSGLMVGTEAIAEATASLNYGGVNAENIFNLANIAQKSKESRRERTEELTQNGMPTREELKKRYAEAKPFTSGVVFQMGNEQLGVEAYGEVVSRSEMKEEKESRKVRNKKKQDCTFLYDNVLSVRSKGLSYDEMNVGDLRYLVRWKKRKDDMPLNLLETKEVFIARLRETEDRTSAPPSPIKDSEDNVGDLLMDKSGGESDYEECEI